MGLHHINTEPWNRIIMKKLLVEMHFSNPLLSLSWLMINLEEEMFWKSQSVLMNGFECMPNFCHYY